MYQLKHPGIIYFTMNKIGNLCIIYLFSFFYFQFQAREDIIILIAAVIWVSRSTYPGNKIKLNEEKRKSVI